MSSHPPYDTAEHRRNRKIKIRQVELSPGRYLCGLCHQPMWPGQALDLNHSDPRAKLRGRGGDQLTHAACNRSAGGKMSHPPRRVPPVVPGQREAETRLNGMNLTGRVW